jgi:hypothetical protein
MFLKFQNLERRCNVGRSPAAHRPFQTGNRDFFVNLHQSIIKASINALNLDWPWRALFRGPF